MLQLALATTAFVAVTLGARAAAQDLAPPVRLEAGGKPINVEIGHAAPYVHDFDGDGVRDLLVGQFGGGKLLIFRNEGSHAEPRFAEGRPFEAGGVVASVPAS
jgi:hypothetical protein